VGGALRAAIFYTYDALGRLATVSSPTQNPELRTLNPFAYTVDAHDRRTRVGVWEFVVSVSQNLLHHIVVTH
jgi:hypothetical protein